MRLYVLPKPSCYTTTRFITSFLLGLIFDPEDAGDYISPKLRVTFTVKSQKTELFITTVAKSSNLIYVMSREERSIFWEVTVLVILCK
jgi:hypothetical protein